MSPTRVAALPASPGARHIDRPAEAANDSTKTGLHGMVSSPMASTMVAATTNQISTGACAFPAVGRDYEAAPGLLDVAAQSSAASCEGPIISMSKRRANQGTDDHDSSKTQASSKGDGALVAPMSSLSRSRCSASLNSSGSDPGSEGRSLISGCFAKAPGNPRDRPRSTSLHCYPSLLSMINEGKDADCIVKARDELEGELLGLRVFVRPILRPS
eukprot:TRINITY_DN47976_c0_g3_i1.p1 TRINITY_DN47976_c0_g3~~TRINITY_DN47976_c0_g3_i1.p1  ORF type:complete len:252 (+),score=20.33 TRINITY_DN47976_c0_g3_i1:112-756(+)